MITYMKSLTGPERCTHESSGIPECSRQNVNKLVTSKPIRDASIDVMLQRRNAARNSTENQ